MFYEKFPDLSLSRLDLFVYNAQMRKTTPSSIQLIPTSSYYTKTRKVYMVNFHETNFKDNALNLRKDYCASKWLLINIAYDYCLLYFEKRCYEYLGKFEIFTAKAIKFGVKLPYLLAVRDQWKGEINSFQEIELKKYVETRSRIY